MQVASMPNSNKPASEKVSKGLLFGLIAHAWTFVFGIIHWILFWLVCPVDLGDSGIKCPSIPGTIYSWFLLVSFVLYLAAVIVNVVIDKKKGEAKLTSYVALAASAFALYYLIAYWIGENAKGSRTDGVKWSGAMKLAKIAYWIYLAGFIASVIFPAFFGGLIGA
jgi:hypothetical protein